jgi:hypothetical protein
VIRPPDQPMEPSHPAFFCLALSGISMDFGVLQDGLLPHTQRCKEEAETSRLPDCISCKP